jgi:hypothetical protein
MSAKQLKASDVTVLCSEIMEVLDQRGMVVVDVPNFNAIMHKPESVEYVQFDKESIPENGYMEYELMGTISPIVPTLTFVAFSTTQKENHRKIAKILKNEFQDGIRILFTQKY